MKSHRTPFCRHFPALSPCRSLGYRSVSFRLHTVGWTVHGVKTRSSWHLFLSPLWLHFRLPALPPQTAWEESKSGLSKRNSFWYYVTAGGNMAAKFLPHASHYWITLIPSELCQRERCGKESFFTDDFISAPKTYSDSIMGQWTFITTPEKFPFAHAYTCMST